LKYFKTECSKLFWLLHLLHSNFLIISRIRKYNLTHVCECKRSALLQDIKKIILNG